MGELAVDRQNVERMNPAEALGLPGTGRLLETAHELIITEGIWSERFHVLRKGDIQAVLLVETRLRGWLMLTVALLGALVTSAMALAGPSGRLLLGGLLPGMLPGDLEIWACGAIFAGLLIWIRAGRPFCLLGVQTPVSTVKVGGWLRQPQAQALFDDVVKIVEAEQGVLLTRELHEALDRQGLGRFAGATSPPMPFSEN